MSLTKKLILVLGSGMVVVFIGALIGLGLFMALGDLSSDSASDGMVNSVAPDFNLVSLDGQELSLQQLRGKPVLINFWATWCNPCVSELPLLDATAQKHLGELVVLGINQGESAAKVNNFVQLRGFSYSFLIDTAQDVGDLYKVSALPTSVFIDAEGVIRATHIGQILANELEQNLLLIGIE